MLLEINVYIILNNTIKDCNTVKDTNTNNNWL